MRSDDPTAPLCPPWEQAPVRPGPTRYAPNDADGTCTWCGHPRAAHLSTSMTRESGCETHTADGERLGVRATPNTFETSPRDALGASDAGRSDQELACESMQELLDDLQRLISQLRTQLCRWQEIARHSRAEE
jgi:hypothetical protein